MVAAALQSGVAKSSLLSRRQFRNANPRPASGRNTGPMAQAAKVLLLALAAGGLVSLALWATGFVNFQAAPVAVHFRPDPSMLRPRGYLWLSPLRDRAPEILAQQYLSRLRGGDLSFLPPASPFRERESRWPLRSWRLGARQDSASRCALRYWVRRGGGYAGASDLEEEAWFLLEHAGTWRLVDFSAIY